MLVGPSFFSSKKKRSIDQNALDSDLHGSELRWEIQSIASMRIAAGIGRHRADQPALLLAKVRPPVLPVRGMR